MQCSLTGFQPIKKENLDRLRETNFTGLRAKRGRTSPRSSIGASPGGPDRAPVLAKADAALKNGTRLAVAHDARWFLLRDFLQHWLFPPTMLGLFACAWAAS